MKRAPRKDVKVQKLFVRNSAAPARSTEAVGEKKRVRFVKEDEEKPEPETKDLGEPEFCSILKLAADIRKLTVEDLLEKKKGTGRTVRSHNVDFHPDEKLFQDLISVDVPHEDLRPRPKSVPAPPKRTVVNDPEPDFKEFLKHSLQPEYAFTELIVPELEKPEPQFDGRSIYRLTNKWKV